MSNIKQIWTIGHSTRAFEEFASMLEAFQIHHLVDIRRFPGSKRFPQYNKELLGPAEWMGSPAHHDQRKNTGTSLHKGSHHRQWDPEIHRF
jgi:Protein of unknown function, DUF488